MEKLKAEYRPVLVFVVLHVRIVSSDIKHHVLEKIVKLHQDGLKKHAKNPNLTMSQPEIDPMEFATKATPHSRPPNRVCSGTIE